MTKEELRKVATEVLGTHFGLFGAAAEKYLGEHYDEAFKYYDVNNDGRLDAVGMTPQMLRFLCKPLGEVDLQ